MRRVARRLASALLFVLLLSAVGIIPAETVQAGAPQKASTKKKSTGKKQSAGKTTAAARKGRSSRSSSRQVARKGSRTSQKGKTVAARKSGSRRSTASSRSRTVASSKYSRSSRRRRARALYMARLRALRARDSALRSIAASNIEKDNNTGEDLEIRRVAIDALQGRSGTVVVMDPNNGRVFTIVNQQMALGSPVKPCSTVKLVVGLAALHEGVFDPNLDVRISSRAGMNLTDAVARSNNPVFQVLGRMLGFERVVDYAGNFGFGQKTGVNYPGESDGFLPEEGEHETGHMSSHGDGFGVTAIQLAAFTSAIANGGNLYVPHAPRTPEEHSNFEPILRRRIDMSPEDRLRLMGGMIGAVNFGTARLAYNPLGQVAGKTGTCTGNRDKLGLFTSFSSVDNPRVVVTVITTGYQEAGKRAAEIAGRIYAAISPRFFRDKTVTPATASVEINN